MSQTKTKKEKSINILSQNIEIDFSEFTKLLGEEISLRSFYNYRNEILQKGNAPNVQKQVAKARSDSVGNDFLQKQENANLQLQNTNLQNDAQNANLQKQELAKLQNEYNILQNANANLQNDVQFYTQQADNQASASASFGYYAIRFLVAIILIGNFANVYNGIASIESSGFLAILLCTIFATSGFCIMLVQNASAKLKLGVSAICILWESIFASGSIYSNVYKDANRYAKIIDLSSSLFGAEPKITAIYFAILLSLTICGILYTAIYLITKKS